MREPEGGPYDEVTITGMQEGVVSSDPAAPLGKELVLRPESSFAAPISADVHRFTAAYVPLDETLDVATEVALLDRRVAPAWELS
jgi:hypothetical protein